MSVGALTPQHGDCQCCPVLEAFSSPIGIVVAAKGVGIGGGGGAPAATLAMTGVAVMTGAGSGRGSGAALSPHGFAGGGDVATFQCTQPPHGLVGGVPLTMFAEPAFVELRGLDDLGPA